MTVKELKRAANSIVLILLFSGVCQPQSGRPESSVYGRVSTVGGQPIGNVVVQFYMLPLEGQRGEEELVSEVTTDQAGQYDARGLDWGYYRIHFDGKSPYRNDEDIWGYFVGNGTRSALDVALTGGMSAHLGTLSRVTGVVLDDDGTPKAGATVVIIPSYGPSQHRQQRTDERGEFVYMVENGSHIIYATAPGTVSKPILFKTRGFETRGTVEKTFTLKLLPDS